MKTAVILRGLPGSGKSHIAKTLIDDDMNFGVICSADNYHIDLDGVYKWKPENVSKAHEYCKKLFSDALETDCPLIIVDNTNTTPKEYNWYVTKAKEAGYWPVLLTVGDASAEAVENSIKNNTHSVPKDTIVNMAKRFFFGHI